MPCAVTMIVIQWALGQWITRQYPGPVPTGPGALNLEVRQIFYLCPRVREAHLRRSGGEGGIRTLERFYPLHDFQSCALDQARRLLHGGQAQLDAKVILPQNGKAVKGCFAKSGTKIEKISGAAICIPRDGTRALASFSDWHYNTEDRVSKNKFSTPCDARTQGVLASAASFSCSLCSRPENKQ